MALSLSSLSKYYLELNLTADIRDFFICGGAVVSRYACAMVH